MMTRSARWVCCLWVLLVAATVGARAAEVIYEPFDYPAGDMNGTQTGGVGMATSGWTTTTTGNGPYGVLSGALTFADLPVSGRSCGRSTYRNSAEMNRAIAAASQAALLADDSTIWFSVLMYGKPYSTGNEHQSIVLGTDAFTDDNTAPPSMAGGEAFGVGYNGQYAVKAVAIDDGAGSYSAGALTVSGSTTYLVAGKITWAANGTNDTLRLFNITNALAAAPADGDAFATIAADLDQSQFDTLAVAGKQWSSFDEIRFATSFAEAMGREVDTTAPSYTILSPTNGAVGVFAATDLVIGFDERVQLGSGDILVREVSGDAVFESIAVTSGSVTVSSTNVTINAVSVLGPATQYWVQITNGIITDLYGNPFAGITNSSQWSFTTEAFVDSTPPAYTALSPTNTATGVLREADLAITFDEPVKKGSGNIAIMETDGDALSESIDVASASVTVDGSNVTINPAGTLVYNRGYYVLIPEGVILDLAENPFAGITNSTQWSFATLPDTVSPSPDPMTFALAPASVSVSAIAMTATAAVDDTPPVEYLFTNTISGEVSGWMAATTWTNGGLSVGVTNSYRVKARDAVGNETDWSAEASAVTALPGFIYEPFDYPAGDIDGSQGGGVGMRGVWTTEAFTSNPYDVIVPGLSFTNLPTVGGQVYRPSAPSSAEMHRGISSANQAAFTKDGATLWFSVLLRDRTYSGGNENGAVLLSTGAITDPNSKPVTLAGGEGLGVAFKGGSTPVAGSLDLHAIVIDDGVGSLSTNFVDDAVTGESTTYLIAGKIVWGPAGSEDALYLFNMSDAADEMPADSEAVATISADLDQALFDTIAIGNAQISSVDEIRFAPTYEEVMGRERLAPPGILMIVR